MVDGKCVYHDELVNRVARVEQKVSEVGTQVTTTSTVIETKIDALKDKIHGPKILILFTLIGAALMLGSKGLELLFNALAK